MENIFDFQVDERRVGILKDAMRDPEFKAELSSELVKNKEESERRKREFEPTPERLLIRI